MTEIGKLSASFLLMFPLLYRGLLSSMSNPLPQRSKKLPMSEFLPQRLTQPSLQQSRIADAQLKLSNFPT
ncbi:hypothetical protein CGT92_01095 [Vibrio metoecus]|nr:hypothetical protein CGT94_02185 [Vibrio metoecus]PAR59033.1 hypothetical protein CGT92_01095 [Vibrio metoecus]PAR70529.1 hypothetical protein CGT91_01015 [Vibrio metoecus]